MIKSHDEVVEAWDSFESIIARSFFWWSTDWCSMFVVSEFNSWHRIEASTMNHISDRVF